MPLASTPHDFPYDADDLLRYLTTASNYKEIHYHCDPHHSYGRSGKVEETYASSSTARREPKIRPPSIPPLHLESSSFTSSFDDMLIAPLPTASLKRSSHIRRTDAPQKPKRARAPPRRFATRIVTNSIPQQVPSTPPLSFGRSTPSPPFPVTPSTPSSKGTPVSCDSPGEWGRSPSSAYNAISPRSASIYVEWDTTGYLQPMQPEDVLDDPRPGFGEVEEEGGLLKRQNTAVIVKLLKDRRRRAGLD